MKAMLRVLVAGMVVFGMSMGAMAAKSAVASGKVKVAANTSKAKAPAAAAAAEKEYTFKGKIDAEKVVLNNANAESILAKVEVSVNGKVIASAEKVTLKQNKKTPQNWSGAFEVKGKAAEKAKVKVAVTAVASFKDAKPVTYEGEKTATTGTFFSKVEVGAINLAVKKAAAKAAPTEKKK